MSKIIIGIFCFGLLTSLVYAEDANPGRRQDVVFTQLPETIRGIRVAGKTACDLELIGDVISSVRPLFEAYTREPITSLSFQFLDIRQEEIAAFWSERWKAVGVSAAKDYQITFKFIPGEGTDFSVEEVN